MTKNIFEKQIHYIEMFVYLLNLLSQLFNIAESLPQHSIHLVAKDSAEIPLCKTLTLYLQTKYTKTKTADTVNRSVFKKTSNAIY